ncbi:hypothetical protein J27TS7_55980 [Paenibacillus dendritiformis]|uniref:hypothetical protein n=1 Tax=Paenibacillus dendritiformis TaxID=130049 RepID=UPI001B170B83|nr:hypothetical protein [Paenibacillus dendritiformis]GIO76084.1 hypothetical protein J27TS7_55980 [Paenibacillus dendritiformis]
MVTSQDITINQGHALELSSRYGINIEDILLIALNLCGVNSQHTYPRMRMFLKVKDKPEYTFRIIVPVHQRNSPFYLEDKRILFNGEHFADVFELENDDVVVSYFRKYEKVITLNSNARSMCTGCVFCYNTLEISEDPRLRVLDDLTQYFSILLSEKGWKDLSSLEQICLSTGCFYYEELAIKHLMMVKNTLNGFNFQGEINYLGSVLRSNEGFKQIIEHIGKFKLTLTVECLTNRETILKSTKADLTLPMMVDLLERAREHGLDATFTYILGLDNEPAALHGLDMLLAHSNRMPSINLFQAHNEYMQMFAAEGANTIEWYLKMRLEIEKLLIKYGLEATTWECYRSLWYFTFDGRPIPYSGW